MPWSDRVVPVGMQRVALVSPRTHLSDVLARVADAGVVEVDLADSTGLPGEATLEQVEESAVGTDLSAAVAGWLPSTELPGLSALVVESGGALVRLPRPRGAEPPTLLRERRSGRLFTTLVDTYSTVPYADLDPTLLAAAAYVAMFGMMFGDVGDGLLLLLGALLARWGRPRILGRLTGLWAFLAALGISGIAFGFLYGEFFGPTGVIPVLWISPTEEPVTLMVAAVCVGALLLAAAYALGTVNRVREAGWRYALYAPAGLAGATLFLGLGLVVAGLVTGMDWLAWSGVAVAATGATLAFVGLFAATEGGGTGVAEAAIELFDMVLRLAANTLSFARLAAFGLTHAALSAVVWNATESLWVSSVLGALLAVVVFVVGTAAAFALEALVAAIQALRLEYYELFSRVFQGEGRPFQPWHIPDRPVAGTPEEEQP